MIVITYDNNNIDEREKGERWKREGKENISTKSDILEKGEVSIAFNYIKNQNHVKRKGKIEFSVNRDSF